MLLAAMIGALGPGATAGPEDLSEIIRPIREKHRMPAMAAAWVDGERVAATGADGVRENGCREAVTARDRFHLGSCTKAMTATLVAILVEEGKLAWDKPLEDLFGVPADREITLERLLTHSAGLPKDPGPALWKRLRGTALAPAEGRSEIVREMLAEPLRYKPGTRHEYSNVGFVLAGAAAERAAGAPFEELMKRRLFDPLEMASAGFGPPGDPDRRDEPRGHKADGQAVPPGPEADNPPAYSPAGRVHATMEDWGKFVAVHLTRRRLGNARFDRLYEAAAGSEYAMGWVVVERGWAGGKTLTHSGSNTLWFAVAWLAPARGFAALAAANQGGDSAARACDELAGTLIRAKAPQ